jgi:beta-galactosidase
MLACIFISLGSAQGSLAQDTAGPNLLTAGSFGEPDSDGWPRPWTRGDPGIIQTRTEGDRRYVRMTLADRGAAIVEQVVDLPANATSVNVSVFMRAADVVTGEQAWNTGMLQYQFLDADGQRVGGWPKLMVNPDAEGWQAYEATGVAVPEGAVRVRVQCGVWGASGTYDFDDASLTANRAATTGRGEDLQWNPPVVVDVSPTRAELSLNGRWQYMPADGPAANEPAGLWDDRVVPDTGGDDPRMWYRRTVDLPADWAGRAVLLELDRVSTDATVWVNGQRAGEVRWPGGTVDITDHVSPGERNELQLLVVAVDDLDQVTRYMGYLEEAVQPADLQHRGIIGDTALLSRPAGPHVADVYIQPSVRQWQVTIDVELAGLPEPAELRYTVEMLDEQGHVEQRYETTRQARAGESTAVLSFDWYDPRLWDYQQPNLYDMRLHVEGGGLDDVYVQRFGFREFWIDGRQFYLNGTRYPLRPHTVRPYQTDPAEYASRYERLIDLGYNFAETWPEDWTRRGKSHHMMLAIEAADASGFPIAANAPHMSRLLNHWQDQALRDQWMRIMERDIRAWRNHPSVVMYSHTGNALGNRGDSDPWKIGMTGFSPDQEYVVDARRVRELIDAIQAVDDKPVFAHHGSYNGDVYTSNMYLNFLPLQEREEWLSHWSEHGELPFMSVEFGLPLYASVMRGRSGYGHQGHSEPLMTEWAASLIGPEAYVIEPAAYRDEVIAARWDGDDPQRAYQPHVRWDQNERLIEHSPAMDRVLEMFITRTFRSWRTMGLSGGLVPWHTEANEHVQRVNGPTLAWIAGPGETPNQTVDDQQPITDRTHHYRPGESVRKQAVLINDSRYPQTYSVRWSVSVGQEQLARAVAEGEIEVGGQVRLPIAAALPGAIDGSRVDGRITMEASIGDHRFHDTFDFRVYGELTDAEALPAVAVFDPRGNTAGHLRRLGVEVVEWTDGQPEQPVAVVGRHALSDGHVLPGDLADYLATGGRLIVMTQEAGWLHHALQLRTAPQSSRVAWPTDPDHPITAGLDGDDLSYWNGSSTATEGYPRHPQWEWTPRTGWRWGNRHTVSSVLIETPHHGGWTPVIEQGFDLAYSPLLELRVGGGLIMLNTLDLEGRTRTDPVADALTLRLVRYAAEASVSESRDVVYLGGEAGRERLEAMGVVHETVGDLAAVPADALLLVGPDVADSDALTEWVTAGGEAVVLRRDSDRGLFGVALEQRDGFVGSDQPPTLELAAGLTASDLRYRAAMPAWLLTEGPDLAIDAEGQLGRLSLGNGQVTFVQLGPGGVPADELGYLRFTRWRQARAMSQVLSNLGVRFEQDDRVVALLHRPDHYVPLTGTWQVAAVQTLPESPDRQWNNHQPMSDEARALATGESEARWVDVHVPGYLEGSHEPWRWVDGEFVYRRTVTLPEHAEGRAAVLSLGRVDEAETTFVNGVEVGSSRHWLNDQAYTVPEGVLRAGENTIGVRVWDRGIHGGMVGDPTVLYMSLQSDDAGFYHWDYISDLPTPDADDAQDAADRERWKIADNPYRYYRW